MIDVEIKQEPADETECGNQLDISKFEYEDKLKFVTPIAQPLAPKKLCKKILKLIKKAKINTSKISGGLRFGLKNVQKRIKLGEKGIVIIAGDVTPMDVIMHIPILCEDNSLPYCYVPTRNDIGSAMGIANHGPIIALINPKKEYQELYDTVWEKVKLLPLPL
ncbi:NHP2 ribonucleoprotein [Lycorma delicatula]|uniref:NHP2 ribonucleoprotein n=1 Tax=Lycorma delicatula TaxID=130591 RepID=UPI003F515F9D